MADGRLARPAGRGRPASMMRDSEFLPGELIGYMS